MTSSAVLRSLGDAKRAMFVTLTGAAVNTVLDAILVLKMGLGVEGAAISTALARCAIVAMGLYGVIGVPSLANALNKKFILDAVDGILNNLWFDVSDTTSGAVRLALMGFGLMALMVFRPQGILGSKKEMLAGAR